MYTIDMITQTAKELLSSFPDVRIFTFTGPLGVGKTTLIKALLAQKGVDKIVSSPTFTYVNRYCNTSGDRFYHFDLYRIPSIDAFVCAGFDEYLSQGAINFIEWPEKITPLLQKTFWKEKKQLITVSLAYVSETERAIAVSL